MAGPKGVGIGVWRSASSCWNASPLRAATKARRAARIFPYSTRAAAVAACKSSASVDAAVCGEAVGWTGL